MTMLLTNGIPSGRLMLHSKAEMRISGSSSILVLFLPESWDEVEELIKFQALQVFLNFIIGMDFFGDFSSPVAIPFHSLLSGGLEEDSISATSGLGLVIGLIVDIGTALVGLVGTSLIVSFSGTLIEGAKEDWPLNALNISIIMDLISKVSCLRDEISDMSET
ncbi:hypothetical protein Tco_0337359 [Tanacetum coccineum]